jgi:molybdate transport system substrate-binding protein
MLAAAMVLLLSLFGCKSKSQPPAVNVYCAAGLRDALADLIPVFEKQYSPAKVQIDYAGSGELLGRIKTVPVEHRPDVFIAAEESYADQAQQADLIDSRATLAYFVPVIVVAKGNPKGIKTLADLARPDVTVALGEPRGPAIGLVTDQILKRAGLMGIRQKAGGTFATVQTVAAQVSLHNADAAIVWDTIARQGDFANTLDTIAIADAPNVKVVICRISQCTSPTLADDFIGLATANAGREAFRKNGFSVEPPTTTTTATSRDAN